MEPNDDQWKRLVEVAKKNPEEPTAPPSKSFSGKIDQLRETVQALTLTLTWRRWSLLAALLAGLAFLICFYMGSAFLVCFFYNRIKLPIKSE